MTWDEMQPIIFALVVFLIGVALFRAVNLAARTEAIVFAGIVATLAIGMAYRGYEAGEIASVVVFFVAAAAILQLVRRR